MKLLWPMLFAVSVCAFAPAVAETLHGTVVGISDGDTLTLLTADNREVRVRLAEIDAPELHGQPFGRAAKAALSALAYRRQASAAITTIDRYGRAVALIEVDGVNVNAAMVQQGLAWAYVHFQTDRRYSAWEATARQRRAGLWRQNAPPSTPPWQFRHGQAMSPGSRRPAPAQARTRGTSAIRVVHAGHLLSARIFQSRLNPCIAGTAAKRSYLPLMGV